VRGKPKSSGFIADQVAYRRAFREANGPGPWPCCFCGEPVVDAKGEAFNARTFVVHHIDHDHANDAPDNLAATHNECHARHHATERWKQARAEGQSSLGDLSPEAKQRQNDALRRGAATFKRRMGTDPEFRECQRRRASEQISGSGGDAIRSGRARWWARLTPEQRSKATNRLGKKQTPETRAKMRSATRRRYLCGGCGMATTGSGLAAHQRATGHEGRERVS
jgi:hypothetical protein